MNGNYRQQNSLYDSEKQLGVNSSETSAHYSVAEKKNIKNYKGKNGKPDQRHSYVKIQDVTASHRGCIVLVPSSQERYNNKRNMKVSV